MIKCHEKTKNCNEKNKIRVFLNVYFQKIIWLNFKYEISWYDDGNQKAEII